MILGIIGVLFAVIILHLLFLTVLVCTVKNVDYYKINKFYYSVLKYHCRLIAFFSRVKIKVSGKEKVEKIDGKFLVVGNHRSNYDPILTLLALNRNDLAFISKPENFRIPFVKIIRRCCCTAIDRENPRKAFKTINHNAELIRNGAACVGVYPEGTRSKSGKLLPFHDGVFKIAQKAGAPIVITALRGTEKISKNAPFKRTTVYIDVLEVIDAERVKELSSHDLGEFARDSIAKVTEGK